MPSSPMLRLVRTATATFHQKSQYLAALYTLQIACRVKPNASSSREGITAIGPEQVYVAVAAVPRDGEANAAVARVFAKVFGVANSDVGVVHGLKSRDKVASIADMDIGKKSEEEFLQEATQKLQEALIKK
ncbi:DUF167 domain-containing protein [Aspergillus undulatus]|uniref:DUF167 domain-containing protein n=1 Tax=Aspergillus undulatus TaxID=1810928 RepID=UPI003CCDA952